MPGGFVLLESSTRFSRVFAGVVVTLRETAALPDSIKAGDARGHDTQAAMEASYEALLRAAEDGHKPGHSYRVRPWWDSNPRSPP
jgi:hypothetical protein